MKRQGEAMTKKMRRTSKQRAKLFTTALTVLMLISWSRANAKETDQGVELNDRWETLKTQMLERSSQLTAKRAVVRSQQLKVKAADRWANPKLSYRFSPSPIETREGPMIHSIAISQRWTWREELDQTIHLAQLKVSEAERSAEEAELTLVESLERSMWSLWFHEREYEVLKSELGMLDRIFEHVEGQVVTQSRSLSELSMIRLDRSSRRVKIEQIKSEVERSRLKVGAFLFGRGSYKGKPPAELIEPTLVICADAKGVVKGLKSSVDDVGDLMTPSLIRASLIVRQVTAELDRLSAHQRPQLELGIQWSAINNLSLLSGLGDDVITAQVSGTIPIWGGADRSAKASLASERTRREFELREQRERLHSSLDELSVFLIEQVQQLDSLERELAPIAREALNQKQREYEAGLADLSEVYRAELQLLALRRRGYILQRSCALSIARWRSLTNTDFQPRAEVSSVSSKGEEDVRQ